MSKVYCQQVSVKDLHHTVVHKQTTDALLELYSHVMDMPDGPTKEKFFDQVESSYMEVLKRSYKVGKNVLT